MSNVNSCYIQIVILSHFKINVFKLYSRSEWNLIKLAELSLLVVFCTILPSWGMNLKLQKNNWLTINLRCHPIMVHRTEKAYGTILLPLFLPNKLHVFIFPYFHTLSFIKKMRKFENSNKSLYDQFDNVLREEVCIFATSILV